MSLPPVVSDPEVCPKQPSPLRVRGYGNHDWTLAADYNDQLRYEEFEACLHCGGRKP